MSMLPRLRILSLRVFGLGAIVAAAAWQAGSNGPSPAYAAEACERSAFHVMIDVGHTAAVPGALSARGVPEYTFNLQLADVITQALLDAGFDKTVKLITATAPWRGLIAARHARQRRACRSLHRDSSRFGAG